MTRDARPTGESPTTANAASERSPLLTRGERQLSSDRQYSYTNDDGSGQQHYVELTEDDPEHPRNWTVRRKYFNVAIIASMAILSPLASSMFTPAITPIASDLHTTPTAIVGGATTGFVVALGLGPLLLAPLSETFGRRTLYLVCFGIFAALQIPTALSPGLGWLVACRTLAGFFGSVGIANGGGTLSDMFPPEARAGVFGVYLLGPILGPTIGPLMGGFVTEYLGWRWIFWILAIVCSINTLSAFIFLRESYVPTLLAQRRRRLQQSTGKQFLVANEDTRPLRTRLGTSVQRPLRILLTQPIVLAMAAYQALLMGSLYALYTRFEAIFRAAPYRFSPRDVGLVYLFPGAGFLFAVVFVVPRVDTVFNRLTARNGGVQKPEFRLPLANLGAVLVPLSLFWFGWTLEFGLHWAVCLAGLPFFGVGVQTIFNTVQNYYIDAFEQYAASAIAAGAVFRALVGGFIPLVTPQMFDRLGYGVGMSVLGALAVALAPAPLLFYYFGERLRKRFAIKL